MFSEMVKDIYEGELDTIVGSGLFLGDVYFKILQILFYKLLFVY